MDSENQGQYLYQYDVVEVKEVDGDEIHTHVVNYSSNAIPPEIDSMFNPGEFVQNGFQSYKVVNVLITPRSTDDVENISDTTHVTIYIRKISEA